MTEQQAEYQGRFCGNCGLRVDGERTLDRAEMEKCLLTPGRVFWRLNQGRVMAQCTERPEGCEKEEEKHDRDGEINKVFNRNQEGMPCDFCSHHVKGEPSFCVTCDPENSNYDPYFVCECPECGDGKTGQRGKALKKALEIINGERQDSYGNPEDSFALIGSFWTEYLGAVMGLPEGSRVTAREVAEMMALFKIARMAGQKTTFDNYADAAGYIGIAGDMV